MSTTTYSKKFQRKMMGEGFAVIGALLVYAMLIVAMWQMYEAQNEGNWAKATFWLLALLGYSLERKIVSIMTTVETIRARQ